MKKIVVASLNKSAGKTSIIAGIAKAINKKFGYLKPFGDKLIYRKKRLWDHDSAVITSLFGLKERPEDITIGFEHAKLKYMYDEQSTQKKLKEVIEHLGKDKNLIFIEGTDDLVCGTSVYLDPLSVANYLSAKLLVVASGLEGIILDRLYFLKEYLQAKRFKGLEFCGVIVNQVRDIEDFKQACLTEMEKLGVSVLGIIPYKEELTYMKAGYIAEKLFAKVVAGEGGLNKIVKTILVGAMSVSAAVQNPLFKKENKLIITSGDRSDMILAAIETGSSCVVITNDILPPPNIISKASSANIPLLSVPWDTFYTAKQIDDMERLLSKDDTDKLEILAGLVKENVEIDKIVN